MSIFKMKAVGLPPQVIDESEVRRALALFLDPAHGTQLQELPSGHYKQLPAGNVEGLVTAVRGLCNGQGIYWLLNPIHPGLGEGAKARHILCRRWLLIDVDRHKTEEDKDDSATDTEKEHCREVALAVQTYLCGFDWPAPVIVDSGNGWHLLYRIDLPNDEVSRSLLKSVIYHLADRFDSATVEIDRKVHNANRVSKLPGTWARKGNATPTRPHRQCRLVHAPKELDVVTLEQLESLTRPLPTVADETPLPGVFKLKTGTLHHSNKEKYVRAAIDKECGKIALSRPGNRNEQLNTSAFSLGTLLGAGLVERHTLEEELTVAAYKCGLNNDPGCGERGIANTIKSGLDAGMLHPRQVPESNGAFQPKAAPGTPKAMPSSGVTWEFSLDGETIASGTPGELVTPQVKANNAGQVFEMFSLPGLLAREFPEPSWLVPGIFSEGLNILAGKPKQGKSMLALNLAITIAGGGTALGEIPTEPGDVLYLSLEDKARRLQYRARQMLKALDCKADGRLQIATNWPLQDQGGLEMIDLWMDQATNPKLAIIDVWSKFRPQYRNSGSQYEQDYQHLSAVKEYFDRRNCSSLVIMHCRKGGSEDAVEEVTGTHGNTGVADGIIVLQRARNDNEAKVLITGRDFAEKELALEFSPETLTWRSLGNADQRMGSKIKKAIMDIYLGAPGASYWPSEMAELTSEDKGVIKTTMWRMAEAGELKRIGGKYSWPADELGTGNTTVF